MEEDRETASGDGRAAVSKMRLMDKLLVRINQQLILSQEVTYEYIQYFDSEAHIDVLKCK